MITVDQRAVQLWSEGQGTASIVNTDFSIPLYIEYGTKQPTASSDQVPPRGTITVDGTTSIQGAIITGTGIQVQVMPGITQVTPLIPPPVTLLPSGDQTGTTDTLLLQSFEVSGFSVRLVSGIYYFNNLVTITDGTLTGNDMATIIQLNTLGHIYSGPLLAVGSKGVIRNLSVANSGADAITVAGGVAEWWLMDLFFSGNTGWCIHHTPTGPSHGRIRGIRGTGGGSPNGGGILIDGGGGAAVTTEVNIYDIDIQGCTTFSVLECSSVTDVLCSKLNGSLNNVNISPALLVQGPSQTVHMLEVDVGGSTAGPAVLVVQANAGGSPTDCIFTGKVQQGAIGTLVSDASARLSFTDWYCTRNQGDGFKSTGNGAFNTLTKYTGNQNNLAAGVAYDVNVTSTAHWLIDGMRGVSGAVTANRNIMLAGNHVSPVNDPAGTTTAGFAPAGW